MARRSKVSGATNAKQARKPHQRTALGAVLEQLESRAMLAGDLPPTLDAIPDVTVDEGASEQTVYLQGISAGSGETQPLRVTATSSDTSLLPDPTVSYDTPKSFGVLTFAPVADGYGTATVTVVVEDGGADGDLATADDNATFQQTFDVTVLGINDLPVLDSSASPTLGTVFDDAGPPTGAVGVLVSSLVDIGGPLSNVTDIDGDTPGIAVTATNLAGGTLWYSTDDGAAWSQVGSVSADAPALLAGDAATRLAFQPAAGWTGTLTDVITFRVWDQQTQWTQVGSDLDGAAAFDNAGKAVALSADGLTLAVGASGHDGNGNNAGRVTVYHRDSATSPWVVKGTAIDGSAAGEAAGTTVSLSSDGLTLAIGSPLNDAAGRDAGRVRVFGWSETLGWTQLGSSIDGEAANDRSGSAISLSGDGTTLAIGAFGSDEVDVDAGHARIYRWNAGASAWVQQGSDIDGIGLGDGAGGAVSLSADGQIVAVGSPRHQVGRGQVRTFQWNATTTSWDQFGADLLGEGGSDNFGGTVSISADGSTLAVGAIGNADTGYGAGHVRVFAWESGTAAWVQQGGDLDGEAMFDNSSASLALSADGSTVVIGATANDGGGDNAGHARVYRWDAGLAAWQRVNADIDGEAANNSAGSAVAVSADGHVVAVGALGNSDGGQQAGHVRVFVTVAALSSASDTVSVEVLRSNRQPTIDAVADVAVVDTDGEQTVSLMGISAGDGDSQPLRVTATSSDVSIVADPVVTYTSPDATGSLAFTPLVGVAGTATITVTVEDGGLDNDLATTADNGSVTETFDVTVTVAVNPPVNVPYESVLNFTSNGLWLLNTSDGTRFTQSTFAVWNPNAGWTSIVEGDFNGDGLMDVAGRSAIGQWWASLNNGNGTGGDGQGGTAPVLMTYWRPSLGIENIVAGDFNGDGATDVAGFASNGAWWVGFAKTGGEVGFTNMRVGGWLASFTFTSIQTGDFNGDGNTDIAGLATTGQWFGLLGQDGRGWTSQVLGFWNPSLNFSDDIVADDFNGDGRTDIAGRSEANVWYVATANTDTIGFTTSVLGVWGATTWSSTTIGDFNGDGQADILARAANGQWWGLVSDGTTGLRSNTLVGYWNPNVVWTGIIAGDADGDGRDELLGRRATSEELARGALWVANVTEGLMQATRWGFQGVATTVEARDLFFARF